MELDAAIVEYLKQQAGDVAYQPLIQCGVAGLHSGQSATFSGGMG
jgi:hypothetical protein